MPTFQNTLSAPSSYLPAYEDGTDRVFRNVWHIKFRSPGVTQKKAYNVQNRAEVLNQEMKLVFASSLAYVITIYVIARLLLYF